MISKRSGKKCTTTKVDDRWSCRFVAGRRVRGVLCPYVRPPNLALQRTRPAAADPTRRSGFCAIIVISAGRSAELGC
jgi:hypothetical protein